MNSLSVFSASSLTSFRKSTAESANASTISPNFIGIFPPNPIGVKSTSQDSVIVRNFQIEKLFKFCEMFSFCNCQPLVIVHYKKYKSVRIYKLSQDVRKQEKIKFKFRALS